jgi:hypothetical protein
VQESWPERAVAMRMGPGDGGCSRACRSREEKRGKVRVRVRKRDLGVSGAGDESKKREAGEGVGLWRAMFYRDENMFQSLKFKPSPGAPPHLIWQRKGPRGAGRGPTLPRARRVVCRGRDRSRHCCRRGIGGRGGGGGSLLQQRRRRRRHHNHRRILRVRGRVGHEAPLGVCHHLLLLLHLLQSLLLVLLQVLLLRMGGRGGGQVSMQDERVRERREGRD